MRLHRLSYANAMSTIAVFIALGGASYAVTALSPNSVGTAQLRDGSVTPRKLSFFSDGGSVEALTSQDVGYDSCPPGAVKCGPASPQRLGSATFTVSRRERMRLSIEALVENRSSDQSAKVHFFVLLSPSKTADGQQAECQSDAIIAAQQTRTVRCTIFTKALLPRRYRATSYAMATGTTAATISVPVQSVVWNWQSLR